MHGPPKLVVDNDRVAWLLSLEKLALNDMTVLVRVRFIQCCYSCHSRHGEFRLLIPICLIGVPAYPGFYNWGQGVGDRTPVGPKGKSPVEVWSTRSPRSRSKMLKLVYNF